MYLFKYSVEYFDKDELEAARRNDEVVKLYIDTGICFAESTINAAKYIEDYINEDIKRVKIERIHGRREFPICVLNQETIKAIEENDQW